MDRVATGKIHQPRYLACTAGTTTEGRRPRRAVVAKEIVLHLGCRARCSRGSWNDAAFAPLLERPCRGAALAVDAVVMVATGKNVSDIAVGEWAHVGGCSAEGKCADACAFPGDVVAGGDRIVVGFHSLWVKGGGHVGGARMLLHEGEIKYSSCAYVDAYRHFACPCLPSSYGSLLLFSLPSSCTKSWWGRTRSAREWTIAAAAAAAAAAPPTTPSFSRRKTPPTFNLCKVVCRPWRATFPRCRPWPATLMTSKKKSLD